MRRRKRGSGEGTVYQREDGLWTAQLTVGRDHATGKQVRKTVYGNAQKEVLDKLDKLKEDARSGIVEASSMTVWGCLDFWLAG